MRHGIRSESEAKPAARARREVYWRLEGQLLPGDAAQQIAFFALHGGGLRSRLLRGAALGLIAPLATLLEAARPTAARRLLHTALRGISRDRLGVLGGEYVHEQLVPRLRQREVKRLKAQLKAGDSVILVSGWLDHIVRPLARQLGLDAMLCNRLEFRDGIATGRLLDPVVPPRIRPAWPMRAAVQPARPRHKSHTPATLVYREHNAAPLSVRETLAGKELLLIGVTGFIGKVWLANLLRSLPEVGRIWLLIRHKGRRDAAARFDRLCEESPILRTVPPALLRDKVAVVQGDTGQRDLGLDTETLHRLQRAVDVVVNSGGLTEFNPDLRAALAGNVDAALRVAEFCQGSAKAKLLHLSTCYVVGRSDGRVPERLRPDYTPVRLASFDAEREVSEVARLIADAEREAESGNVVATVRRSGKPLSEAQMSKARQRWLRQHLAGVGTERARRYGWPNTYTYTKSLAESMLLRMGLDMAVVRPSIVETSTDDPFRGWNEGVNTSAPLAHLLGTDFRQLPTRERKRLDLVPVDLVTRGMTLIAAALVRGRADTCYQLATSAANPCDMRRTIELTNLAHRRFLHARIGLDAWLKSNFETVPVSRARYRAFSAPGQRMIVGWLRRLFPSGNLERVERSLNRVEKLIELYEPFIHDNEYVFQADHVRLLDEALPAPEKAAFGYDPGRIDWAEYWIDIHVPALHRRSYPLIEGRRPEL